MSVQLIQQRLLSYQCQTVLEQENALKEIAQEIALMALSRAGFFRVAAFQGGTCLRILYGLQRFSEDLDFSLEAPDKNFQWIHYFNYMKEEFFTYGYEMEMDEKNRSQKSVKAAFLKADSLGGIMVIKDLRTNRPKIKIKLEIDTNPPAGSQYELKYLDFPLPFSVRTQTLPSLFAGKCHALLCREYVKGRDWYDFIWYVSHNVKINLLLLEHAIAQVGPWKNKKIHATRSWLLKELERKINSMDWHEVKQDVMRFLKPHELPSLDIWSKDFFLSRLEKIV